MKKRFLILTVVISCFLLAFSACGGPQNKQETPNGNDKENEMSDEIYLTIENRKIPVKLEENSSAAALAEILKEGDITYSASDYGGFEKVGTLGHILPRNDRQTTAGAGDVILYSGDQIVLFYGRNSWSYTRLGKMQGYSAEELKEILTQSNPVAVKISLR